MVSLKRRTATFLRRSTGLVFWSLERLQGGDGLEGNPRSRKLCDAVKPGWIELPAESGQGVQRGGVSGVIDGEHARGGGAGLRHGRACFQHGNGGPGAGKFKRQGKADDAGAGNDKIRMIHPSIVSRLSPLAGLCG